MDIIKRIDEIRVKRGWSFYKLSAETGLSQQTFTKWMEGRTIPTIPALQAVCNAFGITLADLFSDNNMIEATDETKVIIDKWKYLRKEEKDSIITIINNYLEKNI